MSTAQQLLSKYSKSVPPPSPGPKFNVMPKGQGKTIWVIFPELNATIWTEQEDGYKAAAKEAGVGLHIVDGQSNPSLMNEGVQNAVNAHAGAIILQAVDVPLVANAVQNAAKANIPVVTVNAHPGSTDYADYHPDFGLEGQLTGAEALKLGNCTGTYGILTSTTLYAAATPLAASGAYIKQHCPSCSVKVQNIPVPQVATQVGPATQTMLQSNPDIKALMAQDPFVPVMVPAMQQVNSKVPVIGQVGVTQNLQDYVAKGIVQTYDIAYPPPSWYAWQVFDGALRGMLGLSKPTNTVFPQRVVSKADLTNGAAFPTMENPAGFYGPIWGVKKSS